MVCAKCHRPEGSASKRRAPSPRDSTSRTVKRFWIMLTACVTMNAAASAQTPPPPSQQLIDTLGRIRSSDTGALAAWAQGRSASPSVTPVVNAILALTPSDRDAVLFWLDGHGRRGLHARGLNDAQIGVPFYPIDYTVAAAPLPGSIAPIAIPPPPTPVPTQAPQHHSSLGFLGAVLPWVQVPVASSSSSSTSTSTSQNGNSTEIDQTTNSSSTSVSVGVNPGAVLASLLDASNQSSHPSSSPPPWRAVHFAASPLSDPASPVTVTHGFAAVHNDGSGGIACVSIANQSSKTVTQVDVDFEILNGLGLIKNVQPLRRMGTVAPGAQAGGDVGPQSEAEQRANCVPFSGATTVQYAVRQVFFEDGTSWLQPGANPWSAP